MQASSASATAPVSPASCGARGVLDRVGGKWSLLVIQLLCDRRIRFSELRRSIDGISHRMLTVTLRGLSATAWWSAPSTPRSHPRWSMR
jgi:DNA-binding HxlR family transcriptional regulator